MRADAGVFRELAIRTFGQLEGELFIPQRKKNRARLDGLQTASTIG